MYVFYTAIVYAVFKILRFMIVPRTSHIPIADARDPDDLLNLCDTIKRYRMKGQLKKEEELYFLLIDIMRSPQVVKAICKDSIKTDSKPLGDSDENESDMSDTSMVRGANEIEMQPLSQDVRRSQRSASRSSRLRRFTMMKKAKEED